MDFHAGYTITDVRRSPHCVLAMASLLVAGCTEVDGLFSAEEWAMVESLSPHHVPTADPSNGVAEDEAAIELGQWLYFDCEISPPGDGEASDGGISCATCHTPRAPDGHVGFSDYRAGPTSAGKGITPRNTPTLLDINHYDWFHWDGKADSLWQAITYAVEVGKAQDSNRLRIATILATNPDYAALYGAAFDPAQLEAVAGFPTEGKPSMDGSGWYDLSDDEKVAVNVVFANFAKSVAAYVGQLTTGAAPFDEYVEGNSEAISNDAKRGLKLFIGKAGCVECHSGSHFTDNEFHNLGVTQMSPDVPTEDRGRAEGLEKFAKNDFGRCGEYSDEVPEDCEVPETRDEDLGAFRTPSLRNVASTGPYLHTGARPDLEDVVRFYAWGGDAGGFVGKQHPVMVPLDLDDGEIRDLAAFLETLTGEDPPDHLLKDPHKKSQ